jgi:hypothetical protein
VAAVVPEHAPNAVLREPLPRGPSHRAVGRDVSKVQNVERTVNGTEKANIMPRRASATARHQSRDALCPSSESAASTPTCSAIDLFSSRGYLVLPRTHVRLGVASDHVNVVVHLATF